MLHGNRIITHNATGHMWHSLKFIKIWDFSEKIYWIIRSVDFSETESHIVLCDVIAKYQPVLSHPHLLL